MSVKRRKVDNNRYQKSFMPPVDIEESTETIHLRADMPGVDENSLDITVDKEILQIRGIVPSEEHRGMRLEYGEHKSGEYHRTFTLSNEIDREKISATLKNGVLRLTLPKVQSSARRIAIEAA